MTLTAFATIWFIHFLAAASPGPAILLAARTGITRGFTAGAWLALGFGLGSVIWALAALFGLAVLFKLAPALFWGFKIVGGLFLLWIAFKMWHKAKEPILFESEGAPPLSSLATLRLGLLTQLSNPHPAVFFGAVFVNTIPPGTSAPWLSLILLIVLLNQLVCNMIVARAFSFSAPRAAYVRFKVLIDRSFGGLLAALGLKIAVT